MNWKTKEINHTMAPWQPPKSHHGNHSKSHHGNHSKSHHGNLTKLHYICHHGNHTLTSVELHHKGIDTDGDGTILGNPSSDLGLILGQLNATRYRYLGKGTCFLGPFQTRQKVQLLGAAAPSSCSFCLVWKEVCTPKCSCSGE